MCLPLRFAAMPLRAMLPRVLFENVDVEAYLFEFVEPNNIHMYNTHMGGDALFAGEGGWG